MTPFLSRIYIPYSFPFMPFYIFTVVLRLAYRVFERAKLKSVCYLRPAVRCMQVEWASEHNTTIQHQRSHS